MISGGKIIGAILVVAVIALAAFSFQLFQGQVSAKVKLTQLE
jgi:hypothetical protein